MVISSALNYARRDGPWPVALFEIDVEAKPSGQLRAALDALAASAYPVAALLMASTPPRGAPPPNEEIPLYEGWTPSEPSQESQPRSNEPTQRRMRREKQDPEGLQ